MSSRRRVLALAILVIAATSCAPSAGAPPIRIGTPCAACGMEIRDLRFACERNDGRTWRRYDAIECLLRDAPQATNRGAWLTDYDAMTLHPADSVWVVQGSFPSPMGGGFAAFLTRPAADQVAASTGGRVGRLTPLAPPPTVP